MTDDWKTHLRNAIRAKGTNMHALSKQLGKNQHYITQLLNRSGAPNVSTLNPIADALEMTVVELLEGPSVESDIRRIAADIERLTPRQRKAVVGLIRELQEDSDNSADHNAVADAQT